jgi:hypothetical protein
MFTAQATLWIKEVHNWMEDATDGE